MPLKLKISTIETGLPNDQIFVGRYCIVREMWQHVYATGPLPTRSMWQCRCHWAASPVTTESIQSRLRTQSDVIKMWQKRCQCASSAAVCQRQIYCH